MELAARDTLELSGNPTTDTMDVHRLATARNQGNRFAEKGKMADNHQHIGSSQVMTLYERQAARAHVVVSSMTPEHAHSKKQKKCYGCNRTGHLHKMCRNANTNFVGEEGSEFYGDNALGIHHITECGSGDGNDVSVITIGQRAPKYMVAVDVAGQKIGMELDTGAVVAVASECLYREHLTRFALEPTQLQLRDYQGGSYRLRG